MIQAPVSWLNESEMRLINQWLEFWKAQIIEPGIKKPVYNILQTINAAQHAHQYSLLFAAYIVKYL